MQHASQQHRLLTSLRLHRALLRNKPAPAATPRQADRERDSVISVARDTKDDGRRSGKLTLNQALGGGGGRHKSMAAMKRKQERARQKAMGGTVEREKVIRDVQLPPAIVVSRIGRRVWLKRQALL